MKKFLCLSLLSLSLVAQTASASHFRTRRIAPRESCGNAANSYCVDVSEREVGCGTRAAEWKICVYAGDEDDSRVEIRSSSR